MEVDDIPQIDDPNVDYNLIQPIHQKRTIAFVNHFLLNTVSFLNNFADSCESRLMHFEYKLQKIEASLLILESQLSSIPDLKPIEITIDLPEVPTVSQNGNNQEVDGSNKLNSNEEKLNGQNDESREGANGVKASDDPRFKKFFKMIQFGVQAEAVRQKMSVEGVDPKILDNPNAVIPGYEVTDEANE